ncbi:MAG: SIR2 family protein [Candidatus Competibacteraceae bacterium]
MSANLTDGQWKRLLENIDAGSCTALIGAGVYQKISQLKAEVAEDWIKKDGYPLKDCTEFSRIAQFIAIQNDDQVYPKKTLLEKLKNLEPPDFNKPGEPHDVLAELELPVYITTNYDGFMVQALKNRKKDVRRELYRWDKFINDQPSFLRKGFQPTAANPIVYHLLGHDEVKESLVLTEDDYLKFLLNISKNIEKNVLPSLIQQVLAQGSLILVGYQLMDWEFRVLFQGIMASLDNSLRSTSSITIQLSSDIANNPDKAQEYLSKYFGGVKIKTYVGTTEEFSAELRQRWRSFCFEKPIKSGVREESTEIQKSERKNKLIEGFEQFLDVMRDKLLSQIKEYGLETRSEEEIRQDSRIKVTFEKIELIKSYLDKL